MEESRKKKVEDVYSRWEKKSRDFGNPGAVSRQSVVTSVGESSSHRSTGRDSRLVTVRAPRYSSASSLSSGRGSRVAEKILGALQGTNGVLGPTIGHAQPFRPSLGVSSATLHAASEVKYIADHYCCFKCVPKSRVDFSVHEFVTMGLKNVLHVDISKLGFLGRLFPLNAYVKLSRVNFKLRDLRKDILCSAGMREVIVSCAEAAAIKQGDVSVEARGLALQKQRRRAAKIIGSMSSALSKSLLRLMVMLTTWAFGKLFCKIQVSRTQEAMLKKARERGLPIVYLPGHKSHLDYILVTFVLFRMGLPVPRIAAGDNLRIPFISWIITHLGGFFIKRKLDSGRPSKDILYRKCLSAFIVESLNDCEGLEIFIEGSRSRSGKPNSPKAGLLSVIVDAVRKGVINDVLLVPMGISYDKLTERNFVRHELMGGNKKKETFVVAMRGAWTILTSHCGSVRVDFGQPFSLQEYLNTYSIADESQLDMTNISGSRSVVNIGDLAFRRTVAALSQHLVYDITQCASLMPTSIVAFLLLTHFRAGVTEADLVSSYTYIELMAKTKNRSVGFVGDAEEAVHYALLHLRPLVHMTEHVRRNGVILHDLIVTPTLKLPEVFDLFHHTNQVTPLLVLEAVVACAIYSVVGSQLRVTHAFSVTLNRDRLIVEAVNLCKIFSREFIFAPPCRGLHTVLEATIEWMERTELLRSLAKTTTNPTNPGKKLPQLQGVSDDEESWDRTTHSLLSSSSSEDLEVNTEYESLEQIRTLRNILGPFLEAYWYSSMELLKLEVPVEEAEFLRGLQANLARKAECGFLDYVETCSMDMLKNSIKAFVDLGYVSYKRNTYIYVSDQNALTEFVLNKLVL